MVPAPFPAAGRRRPVTARFFVALAIGLCVGVSIGAAYALHRLWQQLPMVDHLADYEPILPLRIVARDGTLLAEYGEERRQFVPIERIPLTMKQALLSIEDARFYEHGAVDYAGIVRAALGNLVAGEHAQGASTISMQVARVFFLSREKTYRRKIMEIMLAYQLESAYSKDKILELYMNQIYLGERAYGFAAAASIYFDKTLDQLSVAESAMLAGLPKAPSAYNPVANRERATVRQQHILQRMRALGHIDGPAYEQARAEPLALAPRRPSAAPETAYAVEQVRQALVERFGDAAYSLGLDVTTTIGVAEQQAATRALRAGLLKAQDQRGYAGPEARVAPLLAAGNKAGIRQALAPYRDSGELRAALVLSASPSAGITAALRDGRRVHIPRQTLGASALAWLGPEAPARRRIDAGAVIRVVANQAGKAGGAGPWRLSQLPQMQGALVSIDTASGDILALAGGFDFALKQFDHAVQAVRQPGSTFKPFVFSAALDKGYAPGTLIDDTQRLVTPAARGRKAWRPRNYGHQYEGFITARRGLMRSKNLVAVNLMEAAGPAYVQQFATRFGFLPDQNPAILPLALGAGGVTPLQLTQAFAVFANGGVRVAPRLVLKVSERGGDVLYEAPAQPPRARVISARNAFVMDSLLRDVVQQGTARRATALGRADAAGKTGTSNDARDVWFAGYSSGLASVVWMGHEQSRGLGKATGGTLALPVWVDYMAAAVGQREVVERDLPPGLALHEGDYVYSEYLEGACIADGHAFIASPFKCQPAL